MVEGLLKRDLDEGADSYLRVLTGLIEAYESKAFPIADASEADVLRELMRLNGLSQTCAWKRRWASPAHHFSRPEGHAATHEGPGRRPREGLPRLAGSFLAGDVTTRPQSSSSTWGRVAG